MSKGTKVIKKILRQYLKSNNVKCKINVQGSIGPVINREDSTLVKKAIEIAKKMDLPATPIEMGGATDSRWFGAINIPTIEFGPIGKNVHGPKEAIKINSLEVVKEYYLKLFSALLST